jgi:hypothetical protein
MKLQQATQELVKLRRSNMALSYGEVETIYNKDGVMVLGRTYFNQHALVVFSKYQGTQSLTIELPAHFRASGYSALTAAGIHCNGQSISIDANAGGYQVFSK